MPNPTDVARVAAGLSEAQRDALHVARLEWFAAVDVGCYGPPMAALAQKGVLEWRRDPNTYGRAQYRLTPLGLAVRHDLGEKP